MAIQPWSSFGEHPIESQFEGKGDQGRLCTGNEALCTVYDGSWSKKIENQTNSSKVASIYFILPFELLEAEYLTSLEKDNKARKKREAEDAKKEESAAKQPARTCGEADCLKVTRKESGAKNWTQCNNCLTLFCSDHGNVYQIHIAACGTEGVEADTKNQHGFELFSHLEVSFYVLFIYFCHQLICPFWNFLSFWATHSMSGGGMILLSLCTRSQKIEL